MTDKKLQITSGVSMEPVTSTKTTSVQQSLHAMTSNIKTKVPSKLLSPPLVQSLSPLMLIWDHSNCTRKVSITIRCAHQSDSITVSSLLVTQTPPPNPVITTGLSKTHGVKNGETKDTFTWPKTRRTLVVLQQWQLIQSNNSSFFNIQIKMRNLSLL